MPDLFLLGSRVNKAKYVVYRYRLNRAKFVVYALPPKGDEPCLICPDCAIKNRTNVLRTFVLVFLLFVQNPETILFIVSINFKHVFEIIQNLVSDCVFNFSHNLVVRMLPD